METWKRTELFSKYSKLDHQANGVVVNTSSQSQMFVCRWPCSFCRTRFIFLALGRAKYQHGYFPNQDTKAPTSHLPVWITALSVTGRKGITPNESHLWSSPGVVSSDCPSNCLNSCLTVCHFCHPGKATHSYRGQNNWYPLCLTPPWIDPSLQETLLSVPEMIAQWRQSLPRTNLNDCQYSIAINCCVKLK